MIDVVSSSFGVSPHKLSTVAQPFEQAPRVDRPPPTFCIRTSVLACHSGAASRLPDRKRQHPLSTSPRNLSTPLSTEPQPLRQLAGESSQPQPFLPPSVQLVKPDSGLVPFPLVSIPESAAHQNGAPAPRPCPLSPAYPWASADNPPRPSPRHALVAVVPTAAAAGH